MYEMTSLFFYRPLFMLELLIAEHLFAFKLEHRKYYVLRLLFSVIVCVGISFAIPVVAFSTLYCSFLFFALFVVSVATLMFTYKDSFKNIVFCAIAGYTVQHFSQEMYELFVISCGLTDNLASNMYGSGEVDFFGLNPFLFVVYFGMFFIAYATSYFLFARRMQQSEALTLSTLTILIVVVLMMFIDIVFGSVVMWLLPTDTNRMGVVMLHVYNMICCVFALVLLFELPRRRAAERELEHMRHLNDLAREQYDMTKENIEFINIRCHDLKHQLRLVADGGPFSRESAAELEEAIGIYDTAYHTKNAALNVVLMEKGLVCRRHGIRLSCIADGELLDFMGEPDIYAIFGNLLDNAIAAVQALDVEERSIGVSVRRVNSFTVVNVYNGYLGSLKFENGFPVTTKTELGHGYGLKSIYYTAEKYGGVMQLSTEDNIFNVKLLFPRQ